MINKAAFSLKAILTAVLVGSLCSATLTIAQSTQGTPAQPPAPGDAAPTLLSGAPGGAHVPGAANAARQTYRGHRRPNIDDRLNALTKNLDLNDTQQSAVKRILEQRQQEILRIRLDPSINGDAWIDRLRAIQDNTVERIRAVLNDEQRKKYDPLAVRRIQPDQPSVEDWLKAATPK